VPFDRGGGAQDMDREYIIAKLRELDAELRARVFQHLSLFISYARGTPVEPLSRLGRFG